MRNKSNDTYEADKIGISVKEQDYWLEQLSGEWTRGSFLYGHKLQSDSPAAAATLEFEFPAELSYSLIQAGRESDHRLLMILFAGLQVLIYRYTGNKDIIIGMPIYEQKQKGRFINTVLPIRCRVRETVTFKDFLLQVRETLFEAVENQNYPMSLLLQLLKLDKQTTETVFPLFETALLLENIQDKRYIEHIPLNLFFRFKKSGERILGIVNYNASLYETSTIHSILSLYRQLLSSALSFPGNFIADLEILSPETKKQVLFDFNATRTAYPDDKTIHRLFEEQAVRTPGNVAVVGDGFVPAGKQSAHYRDNSLTYEELNQKANRLARLLREKGVRTDSVVALLTDSSLERYIGILGILKAGGAYLPIDPGYPQERVLSVLKDSRSSLVLAHSGTLKKYSFTALQNLNRDPQVTVNPYRTPVRPPIQDFDGLPLPDRRLIDHKKYSRFIGHAMVKNTISIQATRGCPYKCAYCHKIWPKTHVIRSAENLFKEVQLYYRRGMRKFAFVDDIFNLNIKNSRRFFQLLIDNQVDVELFFPNGLRGDILTEDYIDLMIRAGTQSIAFALETASPRLQKLIGKNLNLEKFRHNLEYIAGKYPRINLELFTMIGFPSETEEEAMKTFEFMKSIKWLHFPYVFVLKIYPNTDMARLAMDNGMPEEVIRRSITSAYHDLPDTLPFPKSFVLQYQTRFANEYFLSKERLLHVLPYQMKICSEDELVLKYNDYLPMEINSFSDILEAAGILPGELGAAELRKENSSPLFLNEDTIRDSEKTDGTAQAAFRFLLLDLSHFFSDEKERLVHSMVIEPLGLMYLASYLQREFGTRICCKIAKSRVDFDSFEELYTLVEQFKPHLIGIRTLSYYREFFHKAISYLKQRGVTAPVISGGPYATSDYDFLLQDPNVELVVLGEGEITAVELVGQMMANGKKLPDQEILKKIPGITFIKQEDKLQKKEFTREIFLLDDLPERMKQYAADNPSPLNMSTGSADLLYLISTSGSTGKPKIVLLEHRNLVNLLNYQHTATAAAIDFSHRVLQFASIGFDVSAQEIFSTLLAGGSLYPVNDDMKGDIMRLLEFIRSNRISILYLPPAYLNMIFSRPEYAEKFPGSVKHIIAAGEQLVVSELFKKYLQRNGVCLHNHYGPTETHVVTTLIIKPDREPEEFPSIGKPIANTRIYILDGRLNPQPPGVAGELHIAGNNVGRGYNDDAVLTAAKYIPDFFDPGKRMYNTGDLAVWLPDGSLRFIGRKDNQVKIRGFRIELGEIENQIKEVDYIKDSVVIDRQIAGGDRHLCVYFVSDIQVDISDLREKLLRRLPDYMLPSYFVQLKQIPLTSNGKVNYGALPVPGFQTGDTYTAPRDETEQKLVAIWAGVLGIESEHIGIDHSFFDLGGHSLNATIMISEIHKIFDIKTSLGEIFNQPTIRGLALHVKSAETGSYRSIDIVEERKYYPLSSAQKRLYIQQHMQLDSKIYNLPAVMRLAGNLEKEWLEEVFEKLIRRHESLRTSFHQDEGEPMQKIHKPGEIEFKIEYFEDLRSNPGELYPETSRRDFIQQTHNTIDRFIRPFDLSKPPLLRVGLIKTGEEEHIFLVDMHHIVTDGTSMGILVREFMAMYAGEELPPLTIQYKDFSEWQNRMFHTEDFKKQETYWLNRFAGPVPELNLPGDFPGNQADHSEGRYVFFDIEPQLTAEIRRLVSDTGTTLFIVLLAVHTILLSKYTGREDIVVGTGIAGRRHADLNNVIGLFINMLAFRNRPGKEKTFLEFLEEVRQTAFAGYANQDYQFEELVRALDLQGKTAGSPLFETIFQVQNMDIPELKIPGLELKPYDYEFKISRHPLIIYAGEAGDKINMMMLYATRIFLHETAEKLAARFLEVVEQVVQNREIKLKDISLSFELEKLAAPAIKEEQGDFEF